ncbi:MAG: hypothetical protein IJM81_06765 [Prevotella sp.]|nr:hypothetical protein [Prevotella sp.]
MKYNFDWKHWLLFFVVSAGLLVLTRSFLMSLGIMMLVLLIDRLLAEWDKNRSKKNGEERDK